MVTHEQRRELRHTIAQHARENPGMPAQQLADRFGVHPATALVALREHGVPRPMGEVRRLRNDRIVTVARSLPIHRRLLAAWFGVSLTTIYSALDGRGIKLARKQRVRPALDHWLTVDWSLSYSQLARQHGVSRQWVHQVRNELIRRGLLCE